MKKLLIAFLLSLSCACTFAAVSCADETDSSSSSSSSSSETRGPENLVVAFEEGEGYSIVSETENGEKVASGDVVEFTIKVNPFYTGYPVVSVNGETIAPANDDGLYSIEVTESVEITVANVKKDVSNMVGSGTFEDAFVVTKPIDLLYIAEQVNKGVYKYVTGAYVLANDIDCGGEELQIIGDLSTPDSYFSGCFTCVTNSETGEMQRYTISNFVINSDNTNYVGLFGTVYADLSITSSGLFYGICLDNFTINARIKEDSTLDSRSIACGGLVGYGVGANLYLCDATNGNIYINGDDTYFSFAGGLIGYQYGFYLEDYDTAFPSEIVYSTADVDVRILNGMGLCAGGISGFLSSNHPYGAAAFIHNSYSTGNVSGALRSGGIAGSLGQYSSVSNCYASGKISANSTQSITNLLLTSDEYCYSNAGGIVGFAENDAIVNDCFFAGNVSASAISGKNYANAASIVGGGYEAGTASASAQKYAVDNCIAVKAEEIESKTYLTEQLGWEEYDWILGAGKLPTINYSSSDSIIQKTMTLKYVAKDSNGETVSVKVNGSTESSPLSYFDTSTQSSNIYSPMGSYFATGGLNTYFEADNGYLSYGYFFDEACTKRVPLAYVPQKNVVLYVGFADPTPIVGTYCFLYNNNTDALSVTFDEHGIATYTDGYSEQRANYLFDGKTIVIEGARLARYYDGEIVIDETQEDESVLVDAYFDIARYAFYDFVGELKDGKLSLYDGTYFTAENPLVAKIQDSTFLRGAYHVGGTVYTFYGEKATVSGSNASYAYTVANGKVTLTAEGLAEIVLNTADLNALDAFTGTWTKSATVSKSYTFDGMGGWSYTHGAAQADGTYEVNGDTISFTHNGTAYTAKFDDNGFLQVRNGATVQTYYGENSYVGTWTANGIVVRLFGIDKDGIGKAEIQFSDDSVSEFLYERSATDGYLCLYYTDDSYAKGSVFGYFTLDAYNNVLAATFTDITQTSANGYTLLNLFVIDDLGGEWICDATEFLDTEFNFNGYGLYGFLYGIQGMTGELTLTKNGVTETVEYTLTDVLEGEFYYEGKKYTVSYNEDTYAITLRDTSADKQAELERKDEMAGKAFVDLSGNTYNFDGKSKLSIGGQFTVNGDKEYAYRSSANGWTVYDGETEVGTLEKTNKYYELTIGNTTEHIYLENKFMGDWAISGAFSTFSVGPTDLGGKIKATFKGYDVELLQINATTLKFSYRENRMPITYFVYVFEDEMNKTDVLVLTENEGMFTEYTVCTRANEFYGTWTNANGWAIAFDGITSGSYQNGTANLTRALGSANVTAYYYFVRDNGVMMSSQSLLANKTLYYKIELLDEVTEADKADKTVFFHEDGRAFRRTEVDGLYLTEAVHTDDEGNETTYFFDGEGKMLVNGETVYTYVIKSYNTDNTATLHITKDGVTYTATLDYSDSSNITLVIGEILEETTDDEETPAA